VPAVLEVDAVSFSYPRHPVLEGASFTVNGGEFVALVGPNGSGKSTLLRLLLGVSRPSAGSVRLFGLAPDKLRQRWRIGYVPQRPVLAEALPTTVSELVSTGRLARRGWRRRLQAADWEKVDHAIEMVSLSELARVPVGELSIGQQQRAWIARAFVSDPDLLVLDEPVAGVDMASQRQFRDSLVNLIQESGAAVLLVSHELGAVADDLDRILVLRHGQIGFDGTPGELTASGVSLGIHRQDLPLWLEDH
jgi:zinc transport system ATP-binding protein